MPLFETGDFTLASGQRSRWKIECDALTDQDWETLAQMAAELLPRFGSVIGVPRGGLKFAAALRPMATKGPRLVVDDVFTTGNSIMRVMAPGDHGCVAFARTLPPPTITPVFLFAPYKVIE